MMEYEKDGKFVNREREVFSCKRLRRLKGRSCCIAPTHVKQLGTRGRLIYTATSSTRIRVQGFGGRMNFDDPYNEQCNEVFKFLQTTEIHALLQTKSCRMLELGCGTGPFGRRLIAEYPLLCATGVEILPFRFEELRQLVALNKVETRYEPVLGDIQTPDLFAENRFDLVLAPMVLHHFPTLDRSVVPANICRWLKPGGHLVVFDPNGANPVLQFSNQLMLRVLLRVSKTARLVKCPDETMFSPAYFRKVFSQHGFAFKQGITCPKYVPLRCGSNMFVLNCLMNIHNAMYNTFAPFTYGEWRGAAQISQFQKV